MQLEDLGIEMKVLFDEVVEDGYEAVLLRAKSTRHIDGPILRAVK
jgi:hypothetical protein